MNGTVPNERDPLDEAAKNFLIAGGKYFLLDYIESERNLTPNERHQQNELKWEMIINGAPIVGTVIASVLERIFTPPPSPPVQIGPSVSVGPVVYLRQPIVFDQNSMVVQNLIRQLNDQSGH